MSTSAEKIARIKGNGIFYTPDAVAELLAKNAINSPCIDILDPACGEGILLSAASTQCKAISNKNNAKFVGCDLFKPKQYPFGKNSKFIRSNFFDYPHENRFDLILMNPPYIQYGRLEDEAREEYYDTYAKPLGLHKNLDMWVYFLLKAARHLKKKGTLATIIPWSLLEADYSCGLRGWMAKNFSNISVLLLRHAHFENTEKRVLLLWLKGFGQKADTIRVGFSDYVDDEHNFKTISKSKWAGRYILTSFGLTAQKVTKQLKEVGFKSFKEYVNTCIGVVTGANEYFILSPNKAQEKGFTNGALLPIVRSVDEVNCLRLSQIPERVLLQFGRMTPKKKAYIRKGVKQGFNERSHCERRENGDNKWYHVSPGKIPDAFFTYRVSQVPYLVLNPKGYQCTNSLHKLFFKNLTLIKRKWLQLSLLSIFGQLSLEIVARHYGNGIIKVEPGALKKSLVYVCDKPIDRKSYNSISSLIAKGKKEEASAEATRLVAAAAKIDSDLVSDSVTALNQIRKRRGAQSFEF